MKPNFYLLLFISICNFSFSQNIELSVLSIPDSLKENANSVVRFYDTDIEIQSSKKMIITIKKAVTVLNKLGDDNSVVVLYYDKTTKIKKLRAYVYNDSGKEIKDITKKDFLDISAIDGNSLFIDSRRKAFQYIPVSYPYTFYYEYEVETSNTAFIPNWNPVNFFNQSIQESSIDIVFPAEIKLNKIEKNFNGYLINKTEETNTHISYKTGSISALENEEYSPAPITIFPTLLLGTDKFHLEGVNGEAKTWKDYGKWIYDNLLKGRNDLPEVTKIKIKNLVKDIEDPIERAKIVYDYVQNKTRYISVQIGIGGWMPMLASEVDKLSYGDCKALTNYTKSLMDAAGVK